MTCARPPHVGDCVTGVGDAATLVVMSHASTSKQPSCSQSSSHVKFKHGYCYGSNVKHQAVAGSRPIRFFVRLKCFNSWVVLTIYCQDLSIAHSDGTRRCSNHPPGMASPPQKKQRKEVEDKPAWIKLRADSYEDTPVVLLGLATWVPGDPPQACSALHNKNQKALLNLSESLCSALSLL